MIRKIRIWMEDRGWVRPLGLDSMGVLVYAIKWAVVLLGGAILGGLIWYLLP